MDTAEMEKGAWERVLARDADASFLYGVASTGVFCRPDCPSRRPSRDQVRFFLNAEAATAAGFRACLRCRPLEPRAPVTLVSDVERYLRKNLHRQVSLKELGGVFSCSPFTVQRVFTRSTGLSPRAYGNALRAAEYRKELARGARVTDAVYIAGFSAPSRADEAAPLGMRAAAFRKRGEGEQIRFTIAPAVRPQGERSEHSREQSKGSGDASGSGGAYGEGAAPSLGLLLVAATAKGTCAVMLGNTGEDLRRDLQHRFPLAAEILEDPALAREVDQVLGTLFEPARATELPLDVRATAFQARVWAALRAIPRGETRTYGEVAASLGLPTAARAVARACAENPLALLVPCYRVVGSGGSLTGYRWGLARKRLILDLERG